ncbi:right-handed parallel beta-helix repeat-containing protein [Candidatus Micrarchaeota archaeon]|nr:right-handed parallel beta-helix repeat-containing protein [Candidatus Micrarchaeota archaeon]
MHQTRPALALLALVFGLLLSPPVHAVDVSACNTISAAGTYVLTGSLTIQNYTCLNVTSNNVLLDLNGFTVTGNLTANTIAVNASHVINFTVKNGRVQGFNQGIGLTNVTNWTVFNLTSYNNTVGVEISSAFNGNISHSNVSYSFTDGLAFDGSINATLSNNTIQDNVLQQTFSSGGFDLDNVTNFTFSRNYLNRNYVGVSMNQSSTGNLFWQDTIYNSSNRSMVFDLLGNNNRLSGLNITGNTSSVNYSDFQLLGNSPLFLHDVIFNKTSLLFQNASSNITVNWTVHVNVSNTGGALAGFTANLSSFGSATANFSLASNATGFTTQNLTEYFQNGSQVYGTNQTNYTPYNLVVNSSDHLAFYANASLPLTSATTFVVYFPVLTSVAATSISHASAAIEWTTSLSSNASVRYGTTSTFGLVASSAAFQAAQVLGLSSLSIATPYYYRVTSCTTLNACNSTAQLTFSTTSQNFGSGGGGSTPTPQPETAPSAVPTPSPRPSPSPSPTPVCPPIAMPDCINAELTYPNGQTDAQGCPVAPICVPRAAPSVTPTPFPSAFPTSTPGPSIRPSVQPTPCSDVFDPVCAVNGQTYSNACQAQRAGFAVFYMGTCVDTPEPRDCAISLGGADFLCEQLPIDEEGIDRHRDCFLKVGGVGLFCQGLEIPEERQQEDFQCVAELFGVKFWCNPGALDADATPTPEASPSPTPSPSPQPIETFGEGFPVAVLVVYDTQNLSPHEQQFVTDMQSNFPRVDVVSYHDVSTETVGDYPTIFVIEHEPELLQPATIEALYNNGLEIVLLGPAADYESEINVEGKTYELN